MLKKLLLLAAALVVTDTAVRDLLESKQGRRQINSELELFSIVLIALNAGVMGGAVTPSRADEAEVEVGVGDLRGEILPLFAPRVPSRRKRIQITRALRRPRLRPPLAGRRGLAELQ